MSHPNTPYGGNPFGHGGQQPVQHQSNCREPLRNPCQRPCGDDEADDYAEEFFSNEPIGGGSGGGDGVGLPFGGGRGGRNEERGDGRGEGRDADGGSDGGSGGSGGSSGSGGGDKGGCFGGGGGRGGGGDKDGCGGCDPCLLRIVLVLPFVAVWSLLRAVVGRPVRTEAHGKPLSHTDRTLPEGRAARTMFRAVRWYRLSVSPRSEPVCRYTPSCSTYAATSLRRHGAWRGARLTLRRLSRCNHRARGGHDPVPGV